MSFDVIAVGTGPACGFFLHRWLQHAPPTARVLWLERGEEHTQAQLVASRRLLYQECGAYYDHAPADDGKPWHFAVARGGSTRNWAGNTPRFLPSDFELKTRYGVGRDWPLSYDDLEPYYCDAEDLLGVAGSSTDTPFPRSRPYPTEAHTLSTTDLALKRAMPGQWFALPAARPSEPWRRRPACCGNGVCELCPIDSKFTVVNGLHDVFEDPRVEVRLGAEVRHVDVQGGVARGVRFVAGGREEQAEADLVAIGGNALFNPVLLANSGLDHPLLGRRLHEQVGRHVNFDLRGLKGFDGATIMTMHGYFRYDGAHRAERAGCIVETINQPHQRTLRYERGRWREKLRIKLIYEDLPSDDSWVRPHPDDPYRPQVCYPARSAYALAGLEAIERDIQPILDGLPVERYWLDPVVPSEAHILGTTVMGPSPDDSVIDPDQVHHTVRNLVVLGSGSFPTGTPANPTLTLCALSLRTADRLWA